MIQVYTGDGKGKTTAAIGQAIRAAGRGLRVVLIQFLKESERGRGDSVILQKLDLPLIVELFGEDLLDPASEARRRQIQSCVAEGLDFAKKQMTAGVDMIILDEISHAVNLGLCTEVEVMQLIEKLPENIELILTGRDMPPLILERADLVTEMKKTRHPYDRGIEARNGIEY